ncbi:MAG TPA: ABC transporter permease [Polyangia bacterium]|nr:ABC transporter permease [Polyangia bacterium]
MAEDGATSAISGRTLVIRPTSGFSWQDIVDIWRYRELLWILGLRDVKVRYKQASMGVLWAALQPLAQMVTFTVIFHRFAGLQGDGSVPYSIFCLAGVTVWGLFSNGLSLASESLLNSTNLVTKVYFPRVIMPLATIFTAAVDSAIAGFLLLIFMAAQRVPLHASAVLALPIAAIGALCAAAIGLWTSAINLQYRDVRHALPFFMQLLVYTSPVFYSSAMVPARYRSLLFLNPMVAVIDGFRGALFGTSIPFARLGLSLLIALVVGSLGFLRFRQLERTFADRI